MSTPTNSVFALMRKTDAERLAFAETCTAEDLAELLADTMRLKTCITQVALPLIDKTARVRWLDKGSNAFEVAYRALDTQRSTETAPEIPYTLDGYRAALDEELAAMRNEVSEMNRAVARAEAKHQRILKALRDVAGGGVVDEIVERETQLEVTTLNDGILDPTAGSD